MSTRAHIIVRSKDNESYIYHHHDGYPEGVGADLKEYLSDLRDKWDFDYIYNNITDGCIDGGYEPTSSFHGDEEYVYIIDCDKDELSYYEVPRHKGSRCSFSSEDLEICTLFTREG